MPLDKKKIKEKLEKEKNELVEKLRDLGKFNPETGEWEATPEEVDYIETDQNDMADRFEDFESKSSTLKVFAAKLSNVLEALKNIGSKHFGECEVCGKDIELARMEASPSAKTCKKHMNG